MGKFVERSRETIEKRAKASSGDFDSYFVDGTPILKVQEGDNTYRILPGGGSTKPKTWDPEWKDSWGIVIWVHYGVGAENATYLCPKKTADRDEPCCLCEAAQELGGEAAKELKAKQRIVCYAIDRDDEKLGPQVWQMGVKAEREIQTRSTGKGGEWLVVDDIEDGYDISFKRKGKDKENTEYYSWDIERKPSYLSEDQKKEKRWLEYIQDNPLPDQLVFHDQEYIEKVFAGGKSSKRRGKDKDEEDDRGSRRGRDDDRGSRRGKDDDDDRSERSSSRRGKDDDDDDRGSRGRGERPRRSSASDDDDRGSRRGKDDDDDRGSRGRGRGKDDDEIPDDDEMAENSRRSRGRGKDDDDDRGSRSRTKDDDDDRGSSRRGKDDDDDRASSRRGRDDDDRGSRRGKDDDDDDRGSRRGRDDDGKSDRVSDRARRSLDDLKDKGDKKPGGLKRK